MLILNTIGYTKLEAFLNSVIEDFNDDMDGWASHAEATAISALPGEDIILEVTKRESSTGRPETIKLRPEWFDTIKVTK